MVSGVGSQHKKGLFKVINSRALKANRQKLERLSNYFLFYIYMKLDLNIKDLDLYLKVKDDLP